MRILIVGRKFGSVAGGVERMAIALANAMAERNHEIALLTWDQANARTHYELADAVHWIRLNMGDPMKRAKWHLRALRFKRIRKAVRKFSPDVIVAFQHGPFITVRLALAGSGIPIIAAERNAPQRFDHLRAGRYRSLIFWSFTLANRITVQLDSNRLGYPAYLHKKITVIPNPVFPAAGFAVPDGVDGEPKNLLFVGRLSYQKNPEVLIQAFSRLADTFPDWRLSLVGEGEDKNLLRDLVAELGLTQRVVFSGVVNDVTALYKASHLLCLPSRWEGFPNVLAEAFAHGLPAVGYAGCSGTNALIIPGINGLLAAGNGDVASLTQSLAELMGAPVRRKSMGLGARAAIAEYYPSGVFAKWEALFQELG